MEELTQIVFTILVILTIVIGVLFFVLKKLLHDKRQLLEALSKKQSLASLIGRNTALGDIHQFIGDFAILTEYDELILLSTTSRQPSLDVIGLIQDRMDFIEIKKKGARMTTSENRVRKIIEEKNVRYVVKDVELPTGAHVEDRILPKIRTEQ